MMDDVAFPKKAPNTIPKIDPPLSRETGNYTIWKFNMMKILGIHGVWDVVSGASPEPIIPALRAPQILMGLLERPAPPPGPQTRSSAEPPAEGLQRFTIPGNEAEVEAAITAAKDWRYKNDFALLIISASVASDIHHLIPHEDNTSASKVWEILAANFRPRSRRDCAVTLKRLFMYDQTSNLDLTIWTSDMQTLFVTQKEQGGTLDDNTFTAILLENLPKSAEWSSFSAIHSEVENSAILINLINTEWNRQNRDDPTKLAAIYTAQQHMRGKAKVAAAASSSNPPSNNKSNRSKVCDGCGRVGHLIATCRVKKRDDQSNAAANFADDTKDDAAEKSVIISVAEVARAFASNARKDIRIYDSGATEHITWNAANLVNYKKINPIKVEGFNKEMVAQAIGKGDLHVKASFGKACRNVILRNVLHIPEARNDLVSGIQLARSDITAVLNERGPRLRQNKNRSEFYCGGTLNTFFELDMKVIPPPAGASATATANVASTSSPVDEHFGTAGWDT